MYNYQVIKMKPGQKFKHYCKIDEQETNFVVCEDGLHAICCSCMYKFKLYDNTQLNKTGGKNGHK